MLQSLDIDKLIVEYLIPWGIQIALAIAIFIVGKIIAKIIVTLVRKAMVRAHTDEILIKFVCSITNALLLVFIIIAAVSKLGVNTTSLVAALGAAGLAIGLSLQSSLQNFAAGIMLVIFRPFKIGDLIKTNDETGIVKIINIFSSTIMTLDNKEVIIPNGAVYGGTITNYSSSGTRRVDMTFGISYDDDIRKARDIIKNILEADERILKNPAPQIAVSELADSSVNFAVRPWVNSDDYFDVNFDVTEKIKLAFDEHGVSIPFPQMDVHMNKAA